MDLKKSLLSKLIRGVVLKIIFLYFVNWFIKYLIWRHQERNLIREILKSVKYGTEVTVKGWVRTKRGNKNIAFVELNDGSIIHNLQIVFEVAKFEEELFKKITTGSCISVKGKLVESPARVKVWK